MELLEYLIYGSKPSLTLFPPLHDELEYQNTDSHGAFRIPYLWVPNLHPLFFSLTFHTPFSKSLTDPTKSLSLPSASPH